MEVLMGKSSINGLFSMAMFNNQRVLYRYLIPVRHPTSPGCRVFVKVTSAPWTFRSYPPSQTVMTSLYGQHHQLPGIRRWSASYCGWLQNPAPVDRWFIPLFIGFQPSKVVQDFFHPQYFYCWLTQLPFGNFLELDLTLSFVCHF